MYNLTNLEQLVIAEAIEGTPLEHLFYGISMEYTMQAGEVVQNCGPEILGINTLMSMGAELEAQEQLLKILIRYNALDLFLGYAIQMQEFLSGYFPQISHNFRKRSVVQRYYLANHSTDVIEMTPQQQSA